MPTTTALGSYKRGVVTLAGGAPSLAGGDRRATWPPPVSGVSCRPPITGWVLVPVAGAPY